jgi:1-acyl-sn-glycerol-3-phosphate acyltransferase
MNNQEINRAERMQKLDIRKVIADKNPKLRKLLPDFIFRYLERIMHIKELNAFIEENNDKFGLDFVEAARDNFGVNIHVNGAENIPREGRFVFASNHPLGGIDGMALMLVVGRRQKDVLFPVNDILMNIPNLQELFIPINKHGSNAENARIIDDTFAGDKTMLYFPAGLCSRKKQGQIIDLEWHKTFISKAKRHQRDVVPVYIEGHNSNFFYNLANLRTKLRIKANIEMLYLVDEMFKQKNKDIVITFGEVIPYTTFDRTKKDKQWAIEVKKKVYQLGHRSITE